jgi:hypothetical protein
MKTKIVALALIFVLMSGCTANDMAKNYGGTMTINLPAGQKFVNATWKDNQLWYITRPARIGEGTETYTLKEKSDLGIQEGTVIFKEN